MLLVRVQGAAGSCCQGPGDEQAEHGYHGSDPRELGLLGVQRDDRYQDEQSLPQRDRRQYQHCAAAGSSGLDGFPQEGCRISYSVQEKDGYSAAHCHEKHRQSRNLR